MRDHPRPTQDRPRAGLDWKDRLSAETLSILDTAQTYAERAGCRGRTGTDHLLLSLLDDPLIQDEVRGAGVDAADLRTRVERAAAGEDRFILELETMGTDQAQWHPTPAVTLTAVPYTYLAMGAITGARRVAARLGVEEAAPLHLYISLVEQAQGVAGMALRALGITPSTLLEKA